MRLDSKHVPAGLLLGATACLAEALPPLPLLENSPELAALQEPLRFAGRPGHDRQQQQPLSQSQEHSLSGKTGAVACESMICSQIGIDLLAAGGNAVDAWIGTQLCVGVIGMHHSGLGGGGFAVIRDSDGGHHVIDYREAAPAAAFEDMYYGNVNGSIWGGLAAGVPGELRGLEAAHVKFGKLPWSKVVEPAAAVARDGYPVTEDLVRYMAAGVQYAGYNFLVEDESWAQDFAPKGRVLELGETMTRKRYAETLLEVARKGADVFYKGDIATEMIDIIQASNGTMTLEDLANYEAIFREPLKVTYKDNYHLFTSGVPSSGAVLLNTLKIIEGYDDHVNANTTLHRFNEAMRFAYGAHQVLGDPAYLHDVDSFEASMLASSTAASIRARILDNSTQPVSHYLPDDGLEHYYATESHGTSHVVAADKSGMAVSSTTTVNLLFGNLQMTPKSGIILNNEMNDFSIPGRRNEFGYAPAPANYIRPGKRPLSSITPVIVEDKATGALIATVGAAGGSRIISSTTQVVWHLLGSGYSHESSRHPQADQEAQQKGKKSPARKMTMLEAIHEPRLHDQLMPDYTMFEWAFDNATVADLASRGHNVLWVREGLSAVQGIRILGADEGHGFEAVGETRQKNSAGLTL
ncbi:gamma-glutamyltransferase [Microdochium trichocladiopsis]|uniref:Glutathione hydrolase n=1 Tax=Microdochium trichocladiopsis TaxID=1682393 RepID=A0A9P8YH19_9PEZI|nr:gamma-glutamyltransferase [Microdochium trichocladiopsis]KAH7039848.1 gamma-glutamyltransferase [Microdochium trichocladiopsis]